MKPGQLHAPRALRRRPQYVPVHWHSHSRDAVVPFRMPERAMVLDAIDEFGTTEFRPSLAALDQILALALRHAGFWTDEPKRCIPPPIPVPMFSAIRNNRRRWSETQMPIACTNADAAAEGRPLPRCPQIPRTIISSDLVPDMFVIRGFRSRPILISVSSRLSIAVTLTRPRVWTSGRKNINGVPR